MKILVNGHDVLIDEEDFEIANFGKSLGVSKDGRVRLVKCSGTNLLHRLIMRARPGQIIDHINGNPLDNRKKNLRFCTHSENMRNRGPEKISINKKKHRHGFKGIIKNNKKNLKNPWIALIQVNGKQTYSKYFKTPEEAARAYDELAKIHHGKFARLNFPDNEEL